MSKLTLAQLRVYAREEKRGGDTMSHAEMNSFLERKRIERGLA